MSDRKKNENELAEARTKWAEDRTIMANERTFSGWMSTGLASLGVGLGFRALFQAFDPTWIAKSIASIFVIIGIVIFAAAYQSAARLANRLDPHSAEPASRRRMRIISASMITGSAGLGVVLWLL